MEFQSIEFHRFFISDTIPLSQRKYVCRHWWIQASSIGHKSKLRCLIGPYLLYYKILYLNSTANLCTKLANNFTSQANLCNSPNELIKMFENSKDIKTKPKKI